MAAVDEIHLSPIEAPERLAVMKTFPVFSRSVVIVH
jgi:hypothetical protein